MNSLTRCPRHIHIPLVRVGRDVNRQFSFSMAFRFPFNGARFSHAASPETKLLVVVVYISAFYGRRLIVCSIMFFYGFSDFPFSFPSAVEGEFYAR